jgi:hypothetical protein
MKKITLILSFLLATSAMASNVSTITCNVKDGNTDVKVEFLIQDLGSKNAELISHPSLSEDDYGAILISPAEVDGHFSLPTTLNDQGGDLRVGKDRIRLFGDGDGYTFVDLVLFKDSGYTKGYVRVSGYADQSYQNITCSVAK